MVQCALLAVQAVAEIDHAQWLVKILVDEFAGTSREKLCATSTTNILPARLALVGRRQDLSEYTEQVLLGGHCVGPGIFTAAPAPHIHLPNLEGEANAVKTGSPIPFSRS